MMNIKEGPHRAMNRQTGSQSSGRASIAFYYMDRVKTAKNYGEIFVRRMLYRRHLVKKETK